MNCASRKLVLIVTFVLLAFPRYMKAQANGDEVVTPELYSISHRGMNDMIFDPGLTRRYEGFFGVGRKHVVVFLSYCSL